MPIDLEGLKKRIEALEPPDQLRLAADLLEAGRPDIAHTLAERVVTNLGAELARARLLSLTGGKAVR